MPESPHDKHHSLARARRADLDGWVFLHAEGKPFERGYQHGYLLAGELREALRGIRYLIHQDTGVPFDWFARNARAMYEDMLRGNYGGKLDDGSGAEIIEEMEGIVAGANANRKGADPEVTLADLLGWNAYPEMICQWWPAVVGGQIKPPVPLPTAALQPAGAAAPARSAAGTTSPHHRAAPSSSPSGSGPPTAGSWPRTPPGSGSPTATLTTSSSTSSRTPVSGSSCSRSPATSTAARTSGSPPPGWSSPRRPSTSTGSTPPACRSSSGRAGPASTPARSRPGGSCSGSGTTAGT